MEDKKDQNSQFKAHTGKILLYLCHNSTKSYFEYDLFTPKRPVSDFEPNKSIANIENKYRTK